MTKRWIWLNALYPCTVEMGNYRTGTIRDLMTLHSYYMSIRWHLSLWGNLHSLLHGRPLGLVVNKFVLVVWSKLTKMQNLCLQIIWDRCRYFAKHILQANIWNIPPPLRCYNKFSLSMHCITEWNHMLFRWRIVILYHQPCRWYLWTKSGLTLYISTLMYQDLHILLVMCEGNK